MITYCERWALYDLESYPELLFSITGEPVLFATTGGAVKFRAELDSVNRERWAVIRIEIVGPEHHEITGE